ncbi:MAG: hypothetical protein HKN27_02835 [Silicimonas sp.]|nr:hypothetical protein [Silicimonas sp.]
MLFKNLTLKKNVVLQVSLAEVHLPVKMGHRDAEETFVTPLTAQMAAAGLGTVMETSVESFGNAQVRGIDLYLGLTDASRDGLQTVAGMLEHLSAPCGSSIRLSESVSDPLIFGRAEGLELSLDRRLTTSEKARRDFSQVCRDALANLAVSRGWTQDQDRTLFYFYGNDLAGMRDSLARVLENHPKYQGAMFRRLA